VLDHGKIIAEGTSQELKTRLGSTVLSVTFASTDDALRGADLIRDLSPKPANVEGTVVDLTVDRGPAVAADALRRLDGAGITLVGLALREPSLDDVFLNLTGHKAEDVNESLAEAASSARRGRKART
jgi:ABC-type multidrug transport system ATPase subunit